MSDYHQDRASEILKQLQYATIATATKDGHPWNTPVAFFFDNALNIYRLSEKDVDNEYVKDIRISIDLEKLKS